MKVLRLLGGSQAHPWNMWHYPHRNTGNFASGNPHTQIFSSHPWKSAGPSTVVPATWTKRLIQGPDCSLLVASWGAGQNRPVDWRLGRTVARRWSIRSLSSHFQSSKEHRFRWHSQSLYLTGGVWNPPYAPPSSISYRSPVSAPSFQRLTLLRPPAHLLRSRLTILVGPSFRPPADCGPSLYLCNGLPTPSNFERSTIVVYFVPPKLLSCSIFTLNEGSSLFKALSRVLAEVEYTVNQVDSTSLPHIKQKLLVFICAISIYKALAKAVNVVVANCFMIGWLSSRPGHWRNVMKFGSLCSAEILRRTRNMNASQSDPSSQPRRMA